MKVYKVKSGIVLESDQSFFLLVDADWDSFINDDNLLEKMKGKIETSKNISNADHYLKKELEAPVGGQEIWASGLAYYNSKLGREEESKEAGGSNFYSRVYEAERPELFF